MKIHRLILALFLSVLPVMAGPVALSWQDTSNNEDGFKVERALGPTGAFIQIAGTVPANGSTFLDALVNPSTLYRYRVRAFNVGGDSVYSNIATVTTAAGPQAAPTAPGGVAGVEQIPSRLVNISARAQVVNADNILIGGFVVEGTTSLKVLIRGIGPGLAAHGLGNPLADPELLLLRPDGTEVARNNNWANDAALVAATAQEGAFALTVGSKDAALLITLPPGIYTPHVRDAGTAPGVALLEIYEVSP